jgi:hypothetical protein
MTYKSSMTLFGLPLVHVATGYVKDGKAHRGVARGWIAIGDISLGVLLSVGGIAAGGIAFGGLAAGVVTLGGLALGVIAMGGLAVGIDAMGGAAFALHAALGGLAVAIGFAEGGLAVARHVGDKAAEDLFGDNAVFGIFRSLADQSRWFMVLVFFPIVQSYIFQKARKKSPTEEETTE